MTKRTLIIISLLAAYAASVSCVEHRPLRTEVFNEEIYFAKDFLTRENPNRKDSKDHAWLFKVTVTKATNPDWGMLFPGDNVDPRYVRFQFKPKQMEMVIDDEYALNTDKDGNKVASDSLAPAVLNSWPGSHVDIKMKDNMDGERTNVIEENREAPYEERQYFKADLEKAAIADVNMLWFANTDYGIGECATLRSVAVVPNSFKVEKNASKTGKDKGDDYFTWTVQLVYEGRIFGGGYYCGDTMTGLTNRNTFTYELKYSFWRPPDNSDYIKNHAIEYKEKDPRRRTVGAFDTATFNRMQIYHDPKTDLPGGVSYLMRFDPTKKHTFYFGPSWPERYKEHFTKNVTTQVNALMKKVKRSMTIEFKDHDWECNDNDETTKCIERTYGDIRYSFLQYHDVPSTTGLGGMAYFTGDPRTGEIYAGGFNIYDWSDRLLVYQVQDYLEEVTGDDFKAKTTACKPGDVIKIDPKLLEKKFKYTSIYNKLESYMGQKAEKWNSTRSEDFGKYLRMLMPELRFSYPGYNNYVGKGTSLDQMDKMAKVDLEFRQHLSDIDHGKSPFGSHNIHSQAGIEQGLKSINAFKAGARNHRQLKIHRAKLNFKRRLCEFEGWELAPAVARSARMCKKDGKWETRDEWAQRVVDTWWKGTATHEFGHVLSLRHNFYGSIDKPHFRDKEKDITSSIMEYSYTRAEGAEEPEFKPWDEMSLKWIYGSTPKDLKTYAPKDSDNWLYCTDDHRFLSPFCTVFDIGTTPTEIVKNEIDKYEWYYKFRNFRAYRKFWSTGYYSSTVFNLLYDLRRFLNVWAMDFYPEDIKNDLTLLGITGDEKFFANITDEFVDEFGQANRLVVNFYKAILQQSAAERSYATKFDNFYGDVTQQGIILDKYYAMFFFLGLWPVEEYDYNLYAYLAYYEGSRNNPLYYSNCQDVTDAMLGGQYDVYPWFKPTAILLFAQDTHDVMFGDKSKQKWIELRKFARKQDMTEFFGGLDPTVEALKYGNTYQTFKDNSGDDWIYYYMVDRQLHLVANKNKNPTAYMKLWDHNESINLNKSTSLDDYTLKYYLDYYHYFN